MLKFALFAVLVAVARAGVLDYSHGYAAPIAKIAAPAASSHASFTQHTVSHAAPVAHYAAAPVAHYAAAPVAHYAAPVVAKTLVAAPVHKAVVDHYAAPHYDFEYAVHDPHTGDVKEQKESRKEDSVHGVYSLIEPDGTRRVVEYTADDHNGFQAVVHREPAQHPVAVKAVKTIAAPVLKYAAPALSYGHAAPAYASYAAPVAHHISHHY